MGGGDALQADRDLVIVPESQGSKLDPSTRNGVRAKWGSTRPSRDADEMKFKRIRVPGEDEVDLARRLGRAEPVLAQGDRRIAAVARRPAAAMAWPRSPALQRAPGWSKGHCDELCEGDVHEAARRISVVK